MSHTFMSYRPVHFFCQARIRLHPICLHRIFALERDSGCSTQEDAPGDALVPVTILPKQHDRAAYAVAHAPIDARIPVADELHCDVRMWSGAAPVAHSLRRGPNLRRVEHGHDEQVSRRVFLGLILLALLLLALVRRISAGSFSLPPGSATHTAMCPNGATSTEPTSWMPAPLPIVAGSKHLFKAATQGTARNQSVKPVSVLSTVIIRMSKLNKMTYLLALSGVIMQLIPKSGHDQSWLSQHGPSNKPRIPCSAEACTRPRKQFVHRRKDFSAVEIHALHWDRAFMTLTSVALFSSNFSWFAERRRCACLGPSCPPRERSRRASGPWDPSQAGATLARR